MLIRAGTSTSRRDQTEGDEAGHGAWPARWSWALGRARAAATVLALAWVLGGCSEGPEAGSGQAAPGGTAGVGGARPVGGGDGRAVVRSVVMVCLDTLRADRLEAYGYGRPTSPNLDALASRSVVFDQARAQAPQTAPSHASLFTSEYPGAHGIINVHGSNPEMRKLPAGVTTLAEFLSQQGITTAAFVSGGNLTRRMDMHRGFGLWDERNEDIAQRLAAAVAWLDQHQDRPFFLFIHSYQVHAPYLPPPEYQGPFVDPDYAGPLRERLERYLALPPEAQWEGGVGADYWEGLLDFDAADVRFLSDLYDAEIAYTDAAIRGLLEAVLTTRRAGDTALVVLSDHGEEFAEHDKFQHDQVFEEHLRVPLMLRMPGGLERAGWSGRVRSPVTLVDVAPTLADLMIGRWPSGWQGQSLRPLMDPATREAADRAPPRPVFSRLVRDPGPQIYRSVVWNGWKYIHRWQQDIDRTWESLFHLEEDPGERRDLIASDDPDIRRSLDRLRELLEVHTRQSAARAQLLGEGESVELDPEQRALLEALGYLGNDEPGAR